MSLGALLLALLAAVGIVALPAWPHSRAWGYAPAMAAGALGVVVALLWLPH